MELFIPSDWHKIGKETAEYLMSNLDLHTQESYDNGDWYVAKGYGRVFFKTLRGQWYCHPMFKKS